MMSTASFNELTLKTRQRACSDRVRMTTRIGYQSGGFIRTP